MTVAGNMNAMAALLAANGFNASAFRDSMSVDTPSVSPAAPKMETEQTVQVGQMKSEPEQSQEVGQNGGMASIVQALNDKAAQLEGAALAASEQGVAQAEAPQIDSESKYTPSNSQTKNFDNRINNLIFGAIDKALGGQQGADVSADEIGNLQAQNVGSAQRTQGQGQGR